MPDETYIWDNHLAYKMVRDRYHVLTDRQRKLQYEQNKLATQLSQLRSKIEKLGDAIAVVEKVGGEAHNLRSQIGAAHSEVRRIEPRHRYLETITTLIAANLRLIDQAHDALHWLRFEEEKLVNFDNLPEVILKP